MRKLFLMLLTIVVRALRVACRSRSDLVLENAAQMASFIDQLSKTPPLLDVTLLFCAGTNADLYLRPWLADLDAPWLNPILIADARRTPGNRGLTWLKDQAEKLLAHRIVLSGSPGFVYAATDTLTQSGIAESALESDVFSYAPRS